MGIIGVLRWRTSVYFNKVIQLQQWLPGLQARRAGDHFITEISHWFTTWPGADCSELPWVFVNTAENCRYEQAEHQMLLLSWSLLGKASTKLQNPQPLQHGWAPRQHRAPTSVSRAGWGEATPGSPLPYSSLPCECIPLFFSYSSRFEIFSCFLSRKRAAGHRKPRLLHTARASPLLPKSTTQEASPRVPVPPVWDRDPSPDSEEPLPRVISDSWAGSQPVSPRGKADATSVGIAAKRSIGWTTAWNNSLLQ